MDDTLLHQLRRKAIMKEFPQVRNLQGADNRTQYYGYGILILQLSIAWAVSNSWSAAIVLGLIVSPYIDLGIFSLLHEVSHGLVWHRYWFGGKINGNRLLGILCNMPLLVPVSEIFYQHHMAHHKNLGSDTKDVDIPSDLEVRIVGNSSFRKAMWLLLNVFILPIRSANKIPVIMGWQLVLNWVSSLGFAAAVLWFSPHAFVYLLLGLVCSQSFHPANARQLQRHIWSSDTRYNTALDQDQVCTLEPTDAETKARNRVMEQGMPLEHMKVNTYSYYGPRNALTLNVGYHLEHHDFMNIPWTRLPELRRIAGEKWYPTKAAHKSSFMDPLISFVFNPRITLADFGGKH